jgi:hypothetical protein
MSVLACDREGCENIMCDRLSDEYGYICYICYSELIATSPKPIKEFMNTDAVVCKDIGWELVCDNTFPECS